MFLCRFHFTDKNPTLLPYRQKGAIHAPVVGRNPCYNGDLGKQPRTHIQQWGGWCVVNHGVDCRDDIGMCGHPLWLNGGDGKDSDV